MRLSASPPWMAQRNKNKMSIDSRDTFVLENQLEKSFISDAKSRIKKSLTVVD